MGQEAVRSAHAVFKMRTQLCYKFYIHMLNAFMTLKRNAHVFPENAKAMWLPYELCRTTCIVFQYTLSLGFLG